MPTPFGHRRTQSDDLDWTAAVDPPSSAAAAPIEPHHHQHRRTRSDNAFALGEPAAATITTTRLWSPRVDTTFPLEQQNNHDDDDDDDDSDGSSNGSNGSPNNSSVDSLVFSQSDCSSSLDGLSPTVLATPSMFPPLHEATNKNYDSAALDESADFGDTYGLLAPRETKGLGAPPSDAYDGNDHNRNINDANTDVDVDDDDRLEITLDEANNDTKLLLQRRDQRHFFWGGKRKKCLILLGILVLIIIVIVGGVLGTRRSGRSSGDASSGVTTTSNENEDNASSTAAPTRAPTVVAITTATIAPTVVPDNTQNTFCELAVGPLVVDDAPPILGELQASDADVMVVDGPVPPACPGGAPPGPGGVWYNLTGGDEVLRASTCDTNLIKNVITTTAPKTRIAIYTQACEALVCVVASNDVNDNDAVCGNHASVSWLAAKGEPYFVYVHSGDDAETTTVTNATSFALTVGYETNGACNTALDFAVQTLDDNNNNIVVGSTRASDDDVAVFTCDALPAIDGAVWYSVVGTGAWLQASTCHAGVTDFHARLNVVLDSCNNCQEIRDSSCGALGSLISWPSQVGVTYKVLVFKSDLQAGSVFGLSVREFEPAANDACENAQILSIGNRIITGSTLRASIDDDNDAVTADDCLEGMPRHPGVWYRVQGNGQRLVASTCHDITSFGSKVSVYTSDTGCGQLSCVSNLQEQFCSGRGSVYWDSEDGREYYILVHGDGQLGDTEVGNLGITVDNFATAENDECAAALQLSGVQSIVRGSNFAATLDDTPTCDTVASLAPGIWYSITTAEATNLRASTCDPDTNFDTQITVYQGPCNRLSCVVTDDNGCGFQSSVVWRTSPGATYLIMVHGKFFSSTGDFVLRVEEYAPEVANDFCDDAIVLLADGNVTVGSTLTATFGNADTCQGVVNTSPGVWYQVNGTGTNIEASLCHTETTFNAALSVFQGNCTSLECVGANDDGQLCTSDTSLVSWISNPDLTYYLLVHGFASRTGDFGLSVREPEPLVENDFCVTAQRLSISSSPIVGSTMLATVDDPPPCTGVGSESPGVWYSVVGTGNRIIASTCDDPGSLDTRISVYTGSCGNLECVFADDNGCFIKSRVVFETVRDQTYYILVHEAPSAEGGDFELVVDNFVPVQPNDYCSGAQQVSADGTLTLGSTRDSSFDSTGDCGTTVTGLGIWYLVLVKLCSDKFASLLKGTGERLRADTCSPQTTYDTKLSIFTGSCDNLQCVGGNDDACGLRSSVSFDTEVGKFYWILLHGIGSNRAGNYALRVSGSFF